MRQVKDILQKSLEDERVCVTGKKVCPMSPEIERKDIQKAMAYDLLRIFEKHPDQT